MHIRRLESTDASIFQSLRLAALLDTPFAFASNHAEEKDTPLARIADHLAPREDAAVFGAFEGDAMIGMVGLRREERLNFAHKGHLWGMYVVPGARGQGIGRALVEAALAFARVVPGLAKVNLHVDAANVPAIGLYESLGFVVFGRESDGMRISGQRRDELQMAAQLA
jgi:ribosomal protein S18 acetylase RimI-like enzyme